MAVTVDMASLDLFSIYFPEVDLVCLKFFGEHAETLPVEFHLQAKVG